MCEQQLEGSIRRRASDCTMRIAAVRLIVVMRAVIGHTRHHHILALMLQHHVLVDQDA
jgi:hypothetical protein